MRRRRLTLVCVGLLAACAGTANAGIVTVPFVGCEANGMGGHIRAPKGKPVTLNIDARVAARLAYYQVARDFAVLGPRGWYCNDVYGSNGATLYVAPHPILTDKLSPLYEPPFVGPVVQMDFVNGNNSSRFEAAHFVVRFFPEQRRSVAATIAEDEEEKVTSEPYVSRPFPADMLLGHGKSFVEYITPPNSQGLGTHCWLKPDVDPIHAAAMLMPDGPSVMVLSVRLPKDLEDLAPVILHWAEQRYAGAK